MKRRLGTDVLGIVNSASLLDPGLINWGVFLDWESVANHSQPAERRTEGKNQESTFLSLSEELRHGTMLSSFPFTK